MADAPFKVGDRVRLNREGWSRGLVRSPEDATEAIDGVSILEIENIGSKHDPIWSLEVSGSGLSIYMLDASMFEKIEA